MCVTHVTVSELFEANNTETTERENDTDDVSHTILSLYLFNARRKTTPTRRQSLDRYQNVKSELEAQQKLERIRAERQSSSMGRVSVPAVHKKATGKPSATKAGGRSRRSSKHGA